MRNDFLKLWTGQTISEVGSRITREGIPLTALLTLNASVSQMGLLAATGSASILVFSLAAGVVADRLRKRPLMILADLGRAALLALIPIAALTHVLTMPVLLLIAALAGVLTVLFDVAYQSYLPVLVPREELLECNRRLAMSASSAEMLGPALTGVLVQAITAPIAILIDAASFLVSAVSVTVIRKPEPPPVRHPQAVPILQESLDGLRFIWTHPGLRALLLRSVTAFLAMGVVFPLYMLNAIRVVHLSTSALGISIALGGAGALAGAAVAARVSRYYGLGPTFFGSALLIGLAYAFIPLSSRFPQFGFLCLCIQQFVGDMAFTVYAVNETAIRQSLAPELVLGRVTGAMQLASRGMLPFGALAGGALAGRIGIAPTLSLAVAGIFLSSVWLVPLRKSPEVWEAPQPSPPENFF